MPYKKKLLNKLYIITPFKDNNLKLLKKTIKSLSNKKTNFNILQLIIYDKSCSNLINKYKTNCQNKDKKTSYFNKFIQAKSEGIYSAINEALNLIPINSYYIVIGAGDLFIKIRSFLEFPENKIIFFPYKLSNSTDNIYIKKIRSIFSGMPYCHNAIAYLNDGSKYKSNYKISADYYHFLKYIKKYNLTKQKILQSFQETIFIEFESKYGLSSKSRISKNIENIKIIYKFFGVAEIFLYFWHTLKKVINIFWKAN